MVMLPLVKLGALALRTVSKPVATRLKVVASRHLEFRNFIISIAQANHQITTNMQRKLYGHSTDVQIRPLNEDKAVQSAADLFGEIFVFMVAGGAVIFEVQRSARSEARKEEMRKQELERMRRSEEELAKEIRLLKEKLCEIEAKARSSGLAGIFSINEQYISDDSKLYLK